MEVIPFIRDDFERHIYIFLVLCAVSTALALFLCMVHVLLDICSDYHQYRVVASFYSIFERQEDLGLLEVE